MILFWSFLKRNFPLTFWYVLSYTAKVLMHKFWHHNISLQFCFFPFFYVLLLFRRPPSRCYHYPQDVPETQLRVSINHLLDVLHHLQHLYFGGLFPISHLHGATFNKDVWWQHLLQGNFTSSSRSLGFGYPLILHLAQWLPGWRRCWHLRYEVTPNFF